MTDAKPADLNLRQLILDELEFEPIVNAAHIGVTVDQRVVTLTGHVKSYAEKMAVEAAVQRVKGVKGIAQEIEVQYPNFQPTSDEEIAKRVVRVLGWDVLVPKENVTVKVQDGWVTLAGQVEWQFQKKAASDALHRLEHVRGISNLIDVKPHVTSADMKHRIEDALRRNAEVEADGIRVKIDEEGKVTLEGKVRAWHERQVVERAAWSAPGVRKVDDRLSVG